MDKKKSTKVTSLAELKNYSEGDIVNLPPFAPDKPFVARLRRPSMLVLAKCGKIPNALLSQANEIFFGTRSKQLDVDALPRTFDIIEIMCEASFVEPTYEEIKNSGVQLTDQQYLAVFNYTQTGVDALSSFRQE